MQERSRSRAKGKHPMGSKPLSQQPSPDGSLDVDTRGQSAPSDRPAASPILRRIAKALRVPPSALYGPSNAVAPAQGVDGEDAADSDLDQQCEALLHAYRRIRDREMRSRLLTFAQHAAEA